jgi:hypothetical protein
MLRQPCNLSIIGSGFGAEPRGFTWTNGFPPTVGGLLWANAAAEYRIVTSANIFLISLHLR